MASDGSETAERTVYLTVLCGIGESGGGGGGGGGGTRGGSISLCCVGQVRVI